MEYLKVKNWERFQHFKKGKPPWIKLYRDLLGSYQFMNLSETDRWCLVGLWILAAETNNSIPCDPKWLQIRLTLYHRPKIDLLVSQGFIEKTSIQTNFTKIETETEVEEEKDNPPIVPLKGDVEKIPFKEIIDDLNARSGGKYKYTSESTQRQVRARWNEGHRLDDFRTAHRNVVEGWNGTSMEQFIRPSTIYRASKFEGYVAHVPTVGAVSVNAKDEAALRHARVGQWTPPDPRDGGDG